MRTSRIQAWCQNPKKQLILAQFSNSPWTGYRVSQNTQSTRILDSGLALEHGNRKIPNDVR